MCLIRSSIPFKEYQESIFDHTMKHQGSREGNKKVQIFKLFFCWKKINLNVRISQSLFKTWQTWQVRHHIVLLCWVGIKFIFTFFKLLPKSMLPDCHFFGVRRKISECYFYRLEQIENLQFFQTFKFILFPIMSDKVISW